MVYKISGLIVLGSSLLRGLVFISLALAASLWLCVEASAAEGGVELERRDALRVCGEPSQLPFSNQEGEGYENKIAAMLAKDMGLPLVYVWYPRTTGFIRRTLSARQCDLVMAVPVGFDLTLSTNPYYRTTYTMVVRADDAVIPASLSDYNTNPELSGKRIGVIAASPPATAVARLNLFDRLKSYHLHTDTRHSNPNQRMINDLMAGDIDMALMWGPIAGYSAQNAGIKLRVIPLLTQTEGTRMDFRIAFGVRHGETAWKHRLNEFIDRRRDDIDAILQSYGVPLLDRRGNVIAAHP